MSYDHTRLMEKRESYNSRGSNIIHTSVDPVRVQVLAMIERMAVTQVLPEEVFTHEQ